ncbi:hypothetical protein TRV_04444, partial [Trichophyton verrucosum HKI 0517]
DATDILSRVSLIHMDLRDIPAGFRACNKQGKPISSRRPDMFMPKGKHAQGSWFISRYFHSSAGKYQSTALYVRKENRRLALILSRRLAAGNPRDCSQPGKNRTAKAKHIHIVKRRTG